MRDTRYKRLDTKKFQSRLISWFRKNKRDLPWRKNKNPYRIWVSEIMLQQTQVTTVIPYYKKWLKAFPSLKSLAEAPLETVLKHWEGLGYYSRARNLKKGAETIMRELKGKFPDTREALLEVPGIGPYTAGAIASIAFSKQEALVDGNVGRVFARLFQIGGIWNEPKTNRKLWEIAKELIPSKHAGDFNEALMELGATVCLKADPECSQCPLSATCLSFKQKTTHLYPAQKKSETVTVDKVTLLLKRRNAYLVRRKKLGRVMGGLYEFPTFVKDGNETEKLLKRERLKVKNTQRVGTVSHHYTRFKANLDIWSADWEEGNLEDPIFHKPIWVKKARLNQITFPSVFRRISNRYCD